MKKYNSILKVLIIISLIFALSSCNAKAVNNQASVSTENNLNGAEQRDHQVPRKNSISNPNFSAKTWMKIDIPEVGLNNLTISKIAEGCTEKQNTPLPVYIFCDYFRYGDSIYHDSYLAVTLESKILFKDLSDGDVGSYTDTLYLNDVDGDGIAEIIIQQNVAMTGGAGQYLSRVFKVVNNEIHEIFNSAVPDSSGDGVSVFDTGFTSEFLNGYKLKVLNKITGYSKILDISKKYTNEFFDTNGKGKRDISIMCDTFLEFKPEDVDGDGAFEISCLQYVSLDGHTDGVGQAKSILKFNSKTNKFEVVKAELITSK